MSVINRLLYNPSHTDPDYSITIYTASHFCYRPFLLQTLSLTDPFYRIHSLQQTLSTSDTLSYIQTLYRHSVLHTLSPRHPLSYRHSFLQTLSPTCLPHTLDPLSHIPFYYRPSLLHALSHRLSLLHTLIPTYPLPFIPSFLQSLSRTYHHSYRTYNIILTEPTTSFL